MVVCELSTFFSVFTSVLFCAHLNLSSYFLDYQIPASGAKSIFSAIAEHSSIDEISMNIGMLVNNSWIPNNLNPF